MQSRIKVQFFGISAGNFSNYGHPHSKTLADIRHICSNSDIISTNICCNCLSIGKYKPENHLWFENYSGKIDKYGRNEATRNSNEINATISTCTVQNDLVTNPPKFGLLAYRLTVSDCGKNPIQIRLALSENIIEYACLFENHKEKLTRECASKIR